MAEKNFLLGASELLTKRIPPPKSHPSADPPWTPAEARRRLAPMLKDTTTFMDSLPPKACPQDESVAVITLHPQYISKTAFPEVALRSVGIEPIGSRVTEIKPQRWNKSKSKEGKETVVCPSTNIYVAGKRSAFHEWAHLMGEQNTHFAGENQLHTMECISPFSPKDTLRNIPSEIEEEPVFEIVLHATPDRDWVVEGFREFLRDYDLEPDLDRLLFVNGLCFMPLRAHRDFLSDISQFSFLRVARVMPRLRPLQPVVRSTFTRHKVLLPTEGPIDPNLRVAVFDGGLLPGHPYGLWAEEYELEGIGSAVDEYCEHGCTVTSALLFGPLSPNTQAERPYAAVDHYRVLDEDSESDPEELYDVLNRILAVLQRGEYQFISMSIGPALPIEDDDVHSWTAALDEFLSDGTVLAALAVGNTGENDWGSGNARVQVPSDCVNGLAVGASDSLGLRWERAPYSSIGPGRSPGVVKPDVLFFGGSTKEPFYVVDPFAPNRTMGLQGTSYATPAALRLGLGIRAKFGTRLSPLAIKALLIHASEEAQTVSRREVGWGRLPEDMDSYIACPKGMARIVYQGEMTAGQWVQTTIPLPEATLEGDVTLCATFSYATTTDPQTPNNYTRSGLEVVFRPHSDKVDKTSGLPKTRSFFQVKDFATEIELRRTAHKWETTLHKEGTLRGSSLKNPVFDIHYNAREGGGMARASTKVRYALVVTVISKRTADLYDRILQRYRTHLRPMMPLNIIPVRTQNLPRA